MESLSYHDVVGKKAEKFYHGFVAGLVASIRDTHWVDSNKESGRGRYDLILIPKDVKCSLGIIIEFKKTSQADVLKTIAEDALNQINTKNYDTVLKRYAYIHDVLKIGLAFCDKAVVSAYQNEDLSTHKKSALALSKMVDNTDDENDW
jgi:ATP-dependent protease Clp ATPase subunit